jgi:hypothetical protein
MGVSGLDLAGSGKGQVAGFCKQTSFSIKRLKPLRLDEKLPASQEAHF